MAVHGTTYKSGHTDWILDFHKEKFTALRSLQAKETNTHKEKAIYIK